MLYVNWNHEVQHDAFQTVIPDGCRDLIIVSRSGTVETAFLTKLDFCTRRVSVRKNQIFQGYRLHPGACIDFHEIAELAHKGHELGPYIEDMAAQDNESIHLIDALAEPEASTRKVAKLAGVSERTLQRRFKRDQLPSPDFWRLLGRVRRAAQALADEIPLAQLADIFGYSDQAHMTREFVRWFRATPTQIRQNPDLLKQIRQPGLGNWTGEQISIR